MIDPYLWADAVISCLMQPKGRVWYDACDAGLVKKKKNFHINRLGLNDVDYKAHYIAESRNCIL
jgi:hypothetical protein